MIHPSYTASGNDKGWILDVGGVGRAFHALMVDVQDGSVTERNQRNG